MYPLHVALCLLIEAVYAVQALLLHRGLYPQLPPPLYPQLPAAAVTLFLFLDSSGIFGGILHFAAFSLLELGVLRAGSGAASTRARRFLPSLGALGVTFLLSVVFWIPGVDYALRYQGSRYALLYAVLNTTAFTGLGLYLRWIWLSRAKGDRATRRRLMAFNALLYVAVLVVFFPYFGEVP